MKAHYRSTLSIGTRIEDFQETASVSALQSSEADEKLHRHVLKIDLATEAAPSKCPLRKNISIMSISGPEQSLCSSGTMKPFEGNLSDDQKLVLSVSDSGSTCSIRSKNDVKVSSGKCFAAYDDHVDRELCSDVIMFRPTSESPQPPPVPPKMNRPNRQKQSVLSESFCSDTSSASSDSVHTNDQLVSPNLIRSLGDHHNSVKSDKLSLLPSSLLIDIRNRSLCCEGRDQLSDEHDDEQESICSDLEHSNQNSIDGMNFYSDDNFYKFHINENLSYELDAFKMSHDESDESFAGLKDLRSGTSTIRSKNGTIRGIKNRVRSGISTFLQMQQTTVKVNYAVERNE